MQLSDIFLGMVEELFGQLLRSISIGRLKTFQMYERLKTRLHLQKLNTESLRKSAPRSWERLKEHDEDLATDISQSVLISHLDMIKAVLDFLGVPHEEGFFAKDFDASGHLKDGWKESVTEHFKGQYPEAVLLFYVNHLAWEVQKAEQVFLPA
jgi:hypothetical protein